MKQEKKLKLYIDDIRNIPNAVNPQRGDWLIARNAAEARELIIANNFDIISFDNDLGIEERFHEGQAVLADLALMWSRNEKPKPKEIWVHTSNPPARQRMEGILQDNGYKKYHQAQIENTFYSFWTIV